ncbi:hypothetical protein QR680_006244 [Steinernema hermaphroditum]|uniref:TIL domain-containing protein n=1 Tax=Steinernema hermaphroditum TaxID=289476 RepID=A0AA39HX77_9BILA|nr:hypothetical protein QR680_006244 [Steinernema hermaphroditum]
MASTVQLIILLSLASVYGFSLFSSDDPSTKCGDNEAYKPCSRCEETCHEPNPNCTAVCGPPKCQCVVGFVRNSKGRCVKLNACGNQTCPEKEVWHDCADCEQTCADLVPDCQLDGCEKGKCVCKPGTYRNVKGECVDLKQCNEENEPCRTYVCLKGTACLNYRHQCQRPPCFIEPKCVKLACLRA